jgi:hypothetical protein
VSIDENIGMIPNEEHKTPNSVVDESLKPTDPTLKPPKKTSKEGKKHSGSAMMDIGVWNPNAIDDKIESSGIISIFNFYFLFLDTFSLFDSERRGS